MSHRFTTKVEENEFGEYVITFPDDILEELGWSVGDTLDYNIEDDVLTLKKYNE